MCSGAFVCLQNPPTLPYAVLPPDRKCAPGRRQGELRRQVVDVGRARVSREKLEEADGVRNQEQRGAEQRAEDGDAAGGDGARADCRGASACVGAVGGRSSSAKGVIQIILSVWVRTGA